MPQFEAAGAQVLGVSADHVATLDAFVKQNPLKHTLASDFRRTMLPGYGALVTDEKSPIYRYAKRAYFVIDSTGRGPLRQGDGQPARPAPARGPAQGAQGVRSVMMRWAAAVGILLLAAQTAAAAPNWAALEAQPYEPPEAGARFRAAGPRRQGDAPRGPARKGGAALLLGDLVTDLPGGVASRQQALHGAPVEGARGQARELPRGRRRWSSARPPSAATRRPSSLTARATSRGSATASSARPTAYLIDRQGRLVARMVGERDWSTPAVKSLLLEVLKQPAK